MNFANVQNFSPYLLLNSRKRLSRTFNRQDRPKKIPYIFGTLLNCGIFVEN